MMFNARSRLVVLYEERALSDKFGQSNDEYRREVGRWVPRL